MDFEFTNFQGNMVLISGAMSKFQTDSRIYKLQGRPLVLSRRGHVVPFNMKKQQLLIDHVKRIFRKKLDKLNPLLNELYLSLSTSRSRSTLYPEYIDGYLNRNGQWPILVLWNGSTDLHILDRLSIYVPITLNLTAYDDDNNYHFYLKLINFVNNELICSHHIGRVIKNGRMLSLEEAHTCINCNVEHDTDTVHDPVVDVSYTKCIFNYLLRLEGYNRIFMKIIK